ncbi:MAG: hypothetical protein JWM16_1724 [Verrucomicrobiales bacterium]|nr:hypothetical protein [Verrucomicrobiales bacterium]
MKQLFNKQQCLLRISDVDRNALEALVFRRYPHREWGTFFRFGYRITPWGVHASFVDTLSPKPGELKRDSGIVEFDAGYILRAQLAMTQTGLGIGVIHSHPQGCSTYASSLDDDMDAYFAGEFATYGQGRPYLTLRVVKDRSHNFSFSGELWLAGERMAVTEILTVGGTLQREQGEQFLGGCKGKVDAPARDEQARVAELLGARNLRRLKRGVVAVVGCSGTGSPAVHVLARAGIKQFVLVDPEFFTNSNHERFHASTSQDLNKHQLKVQMMRRLIHSIDPEVAVTAIRGNVLDELVLDELLRCDLVLGCTDTQHSRAALSDFASHYLLPCIDAGVLMRAEKGQLTEQVGEFARYSPEESCAWCLGRINQKALAWELMSAVEREQRAQAAAEAIRHGIDGEQYWGGTPPKELTVGYLTTAVGAILAGYARGWITGSSTMPHQRFQFDLGMPLLGAVPAEKPRRSECSCGRTKGWADQARADRSVSRPPHFPRPEFVAPAHEGLPCHETITCLSVS